MSLEARERTQDGFWKCCCSSSLGSADRRRPGNTRGLLSAVRAGGCATPTGFAASAVAEATHALAFKSYHPIPKMGLVTLRAHLQPYVEQLLEIIGDEPLLHNTASAERHGCALQSDDRPLTKSENRGPRLGRGV